jgi:hypothetical protein
MDADGSGAIDTDGLGAAFNVSVRGEGESTGTQEGVLCSLLLDRSTSAGATVLGATAKVQLNWVQLTRVQPPRREQVQRTGQGRRANQCTVLYLQWWGLHATSKCRSAVNMWTCMCWGPIEGASSTSSNPNVLQTLEVCDLLLLLCCCCCYCCCCCCGCSCWA